MKLATIVRIRDRVNTGTQAERLKSEVTKGSTDKTTFAELNLQTNGIFLFSHFF